jgi:NTP pyrophosphatase (non-canonical NTP hydrolase)
MSIKTNMRKGVVEKLKALNLDACEDSHERLAAICRTVNNPNFGWTLGACEVLRGRLIYLLRGDSDDADASEDDGPAVPCAAGRADDRERHQQPTEDVDPDVMSLSVRTFEMDTPKGVAAKVLEEAAEAFAAWQEANSCCLNGYVLGATCKSCALIADTISCQEHEALADELADVVQVVCNLAARYGIDMGAAMRRCERRQHERGRL